LPSKDEDTKETHNITTSRNSFLVEGLTCKEILAAQHDSSCNRIICKGLPAGERNHFNLRRKLKRIKESSTKNIVLKG
jgi:hypothetical protein